MKEYTIGFCSALLIIAAFSQALEPKFDIEELYRFCMVKNITLEKCVIPKKPYKGLKPND